MVSASDWNWVEVFCLRSMQFNEGHKVYTMQTDKDTHDGRQINDGGPAYPSGIQPEGYRHEGGAFEFGMSLRDYFAGQALAGVWAGRESDFVKISAPTTTDVAVACYAIADAMLKARNAK